MSLMTQVGFNRCSEFNTVNNKQCGQVATKKDDNERPLCEVHYAIFQRITHGKPTVRRPTKKEEIIEICQSMRELTKRLTFLVNDPKAL